MKITKRNEQQKKKNKIITDVIDFFEKNRKRNKEKDESS